MARKKNKKAKAKSEAEGQSRNITENRKVRHKYEVVEQVECGIVLVGSEVKSLREQTLSISEAYVRLEKKELWLIGADIPEYRQANIWNHDPKRQRKLLCHRAQLEKLSVRAFQKGMTLVPLRVYFNARGIVKVMVGVCRGKKIYDKRESQKTKDVKRQIDRAMKNRN